MTFNVLIVDKVRQDASLSLKYGGDIGAHFRNFSHDIIRIFGNFCLPFIRFLFIIEDLEID